MAKQWHQLERLDHKALKKLQAEREKAAKLAAKAEERKKQLIIAGIIVFCLGLVITLVVVISKRNQEKAHLEERAELLYSSVTEFNGTAEYRKTGLWEALTTNLKFNEAHTFRTSEESSVSVQMQLENQVKLYSGTEAIVNPPTLDAKENRIVKETVELANGELTCAVSLDGKDLMNIKAAGINVLGKSGLFKVIYNNESGKGEVVVKNGLVEVTKIDSGDSPTRLSGFYKLTFTEEEISSPTQASVIQYDWR